MSDNGMSPKRKKWYIEEGKVTNLHCNMEIQFDTLKNKPFSNARERLSENRTFQGLRYLDFLFRLWLLINYVTFPSNLSSLDIYCIYVK